MGNIRHYYYRAIYLPLVSGLVSSLDTLFNGASIVEGVLLNKDGTKSSCSDAECLKHNKVLELSKVKRWEI